MKRTYTGYIVGEWQTGKAKFEPNGYWVGAGGRRITSYIRVDKPDNRQYSRDKYNWFYVETVD